MSLLSEPGYIYAFQKIILKAGQIENPVEKIRQFATKLQLPWIGVNRKIR
jgi:hypothetical protein